MPAKASQGMQDKRVVVCETRSHYDTLMSSYDSGDWNETWETLVQRQRICTLVPVDTPVDILAYVYKPDESLGVRFLRSDMCEYRILVGYVKVRVPQRKLDRMTLPPVAAWGSALAFDEYPAEGSLWDQFCG